MRRMFRVLFGFLIACIAAALATLLFVVTPAELIGWMSLDDGGERFARFGLLWLAASTRNALFSAPFALVAVIVAEWLGQRDWIYYANAGLIIAVLGFLAQWASEPTGQNWSVVNSSYPLVAFLATGFVGGFVYWMWTGRHAGGPSRSAAAPVAAPAEQTKTAVAAEKAEAVAKT